jgi:hypothetical protein
MQEAVNGREPFGETAEAFRTVMELPMPRCGEGSVWLMSFEGQGTNASCQYNEMDALDFNRIEMLYLLKH